MISILGDEEKRALYDQTGCVDDTVSASVLAIFLGLVSPGLQDALRPLKFAVYAF